MTNEEAIFIINNRLNTYYCTDEDIKALDKAIEALNNEPKKGKWITKHYAFNELNAPEKSKLDFVQCPFCKTIHQGRHNFCSFCGADMREKENDT